MWCLMGIVFDNILSPWNLSTCGILTDMNYIIFKAENNQKYTITFNLWIALTNMEEDLGLGLSIPFMLI